MRSRAIGAPNILIFRPAITIVMAAVALVLSGASALAQAVHLSVPQTGGMPGAPVLTGAKLVSNGVAITWDGPSGYYQVFQKRNLDGSWQALGGATNLSRKLTVAAPYSNAFFRVKGPSANYTGSAACAECHSDVLAVSSKTAHARAFSDAAFASAGGRTNSACLDCHTVGHGVITGFVSASKTPGLEGAQCENCHGPAGNHAANPEDSTVRPRVEIASAMCGGCHSGDRSPEYSEWKGGAHASVVMDMNTSDRVSACGRCHSGAARLALLDGETPAIGDANMPLGCVTCHNPHQTNAYPYQLRNPLTSTNDYSMAATDAFSSKYNAKISVCGQCHNRRGADYTMTNEPPHFSAQYNFFLGTVGELYTNIGAHVPGAHGKLTNQCLACHMQSVAFVAGTNQSTVQAAVTGHSFRVDSYALCEACHPWPEGLVAFTQEATQSRLEDTVQYLNFWAERRAPAALWNKYQELSWEYVLPGGLSSGSAGPDPVEQALIPDAIKKARFNLYLVYNEGSSGIHNPPYVTALLDSARKWIQQELGPGLTLPPATAR